MGWRLFIGKEVGGKMEKLQKRGERSCTIAQRSQSHKWHVRVKTSGLKMVNERLCGPWLSTCVLFTKCQKSSKCDFTRVV